MHRIDGAGATPDNRFTEGSPQAGVPATVVTADWLNSVQEELVAVIGAEKLNKGKTSQLIGAINDLMAGREVGRLGFRICDPANLPTLAPNELVPAGQILNRSDYPKLWDYIAASGCVVSDSQWQQPHMEAFFSSGNGSTTFRPGNLVTGVFPRFIDLSSLYDPDRGSRTGGNKPGGWQEDASRKITGHFSGGNNHTSSGSTGEGAIRIANMIESNASLQRYSLQSFAVYGSMDFDSSRVVPTGLDGRPYNILVLPVYTWK